MTLNLFQYIPFYTTHLYMYACHLFLALFIRVLITMMLGRRSYLDQVDILVHHWRPIYEPQLAEKYTAVLKALTLPHQLKRTPPLGNLKQRAL